jgi:VanZ family protein
MHRIFQIATWILILAIAALSLVPPTARPVTPAGSGFEHALIFAATGAASYLGYPRRPYVVIGALLVFATAIELAQFMVPGRHPRLSDLLIDGAASCLGVALSLAASRVWRRMAQR